MRSAFSRSYLSSLEAAQARAIARLHDVMPDAVVSRRYQVLVNGFAVSVPYARLPKLLEAGVAEKVYPSYSYRLNLNRGPSVLGALQFGAATGARGQGVKVAVVDDGVDHEHPFLDPTGFSFPAGFPKGTTGSTTPKVIVARGFAGPGATSTPLDREQSFHGTHVAGVIAGVKTDVEAGQRGFCGEANGGCHPAVKDLEGVAPRAYIGNYRVFNVPAPAPLGGCCSANSPEIVAAFEAAVRDGMDVINFSGGGPQADPRTDVLIEAVSNVVRAGVVPVISAGNDRDFFGLGTAGSPATAPDAISVGAVANAHVFGASLQVVAPSGLPRMPFVASDNIPPGWISANQQARRHSEDPGRQPAALRQRAGGIPERRDRPRRARWVCLWREGVSGEGGGRDGHRHHGEPAGRPDVRVHLGALGRNDLRSRRCTDPRSGGRGRRGDGSLHEGHHGGADHLGGRADELHVLRAHAVRACAQAGRDGAGSADPLVDASRIRRRQFRARSIRSARRDELLGAARRRRSRASHAAASDLDAAADEVGAHVHGRSRVRRHDAHGGGLRARPGGGARPGRLRRQAHALHRPAVALLRLPRRRWWCELEVHIRHRLRRGRRGGHVGRRGAAPGRIRGRDGRGRAGDDPARRDGGHADHCPGRGGRRAGRQLRVRPAPAWQRRSSDPVRVLGLAVVADGRSGHGPQDAPVRRHADRGGSRARVPLADVAVLDPRHLRRRPVGQRRRQGEALLARTSRSRRSTPVSSS